MISPLRVHLLGTVETTHPVVTHLLALAPEHDAPVAFDYHSRLAPGPAAEPTLHALAEADLIIHLVALDDSLPHEFDWAGRALALAQRWENDCTPNLDAPRMVLLTGQHEACGAQLISWIETHTSRPSVQRLLTRRPPNLAQAERGPLIFSDFAHFTQWASLLADTLLFVATTSDEHDERTYLLREQFDLTPELSHPSDQALAFFSDPPLPSAQSPLPAVADGTPVEFDVYAPASAAPGASFTIELWTGYRAHLVRGRKRVPPATAHGPALTFLLSIPGLQVADPVARCTWEGVPADAAWTVRIPPRARLGSLEGVVSVHVGGICIARVRFSISIRKQAAQPLALRPVHVQSPRNITATFATEDRDAALARLAAARSIQPRLEIATDATCGPRDVHFLFWSHRAAASAEVEAAWRNALAAGSPPIEIVMLEDAPLPKKLRRLPASRNN